MGLPGQTFRIVNDTIVIDGEARPTPKNAQFNYIFATSRPLSDDDLRDLDITATDIYGYAPGSASRVNLAPFLPGAAENTYAYTAPLTQGMIEAMRGSGLLLDAVKFNDIAGYFAEMDLSSYLFPYGSEGDWTLSNYGGDEGLPFPARATP